MAVILLLQNLKQQSKIWRKIKLNEMNFIMEKFNEDAVIDLSEKIKSIFEEFIYEASSPTIKAAARRARQHTLKLTKLMKEYRAISIK